MTLRDWPIIGLVERYNALYAPTKTAFEDHQLAISRKVQSGEAPKALEETFNAAKLWADAPFCRLPATLSVPKCPGVQ